MKSSASKNSARTETVKEKSIRIEDLSICLNLSLKDRLSLPNCLAVYIVYVAHTQQVLYVGKTRFLRNRMQQHRKLVHDNNTYHKDKDFRVAWFPLRDAVLVDQIERALIWEYSPMYNNRGIDYKRLTYEML